METALEIHRRSFLISSASLASAAVTGCATSSSSNTANTGNTVNTAALKANADALLRGGVESGDVPGVVAMATTRDTTIYEGAFGRLVQGEPAAMSLDTVGWMASMTKPITGTAAMQLVEQGRLELDSPAQKWVPDIAKVQVLDGWDGDKPRLRAPKRAITLRHLMTHTSGFVYDTWNAEMMRYQKATDFPRLGTGRKVALGAPLAFDPGERWEYGISIDWVGQMVEAVSGRTLGQYFQENNFRPLGMTSTAFRITPEMRTRMAKIHNRGADGKLAPSAFELNQNAELDIGGGGLYGTMPDYVKFMRVFLNGGVSNGNRILRAETVELMSKNAMGPLKVTMLPSQIPGASNHAEFFPGMPKNWGLTFMINEQTAPTGRSAGSLAWAGLSNCYFWIDQRKGVAGTYLTQILPFVDVKATPLFFAFEKAVYQSMG